MSSSWRSSTWGNEISLEYGKGLRNYQESTGPVPVFGTNGQVGWTDEKPLAEGPGIILGRKGAYRGIHFSRSPFFVIDTAYFVKPKTALNMRWLYYSIIHHQLGSIDDGSPIPSTTRAAVYVRNVDIPDDHEQRAIGKVLGDLDDKIELLGRMNATLDEIAHALFRAWFIDFLPVHAKAEGATSFRGMPKALFDALPSSFEASEIGEIPTGWRTKPLDKLADFLNGLAMQKHRPTGDDEGLPVIKIAELRRGLSDKTERASSAIPDKYKVHDGDLIFSWSGSLMAKFWTDGEGALNQHLFKVTSDCSPLALVAHWVWHHLERFQRIAEAKATTMGHIKREHLSEALVVLPPDDRLHEFSEILHLLVQKQIANSLEQRTLVSIRDTLLPKLISGELEAPSLDALGISEAA